MKPQSFRLVILNRFAGKKLALSIYTHFNTLKKKAVGKHCEQFHLFPQCFPYNLYLRILYRCIREWVK